MVINLLDSRHVMCNNLQQCWDVSNSLHTVLFCFVFATNTVETSDSLSETLTFLLGTHYTEIIYYTNLCMSITPFSRQASCHHYHGHVCSDYLDKTKLLYLSKSPKKLEESLRSPFHLLKPRLLEQCAKYALKAICVNMYPYCSSSRKPIKPVRLCKEDCEELESTICASDFKVAREFKYLAVILPNCTVLPPRGSTGAEGCIQLNISGKYTIWLLKWWSELTFYKHHQVLLTCLCLQFTCHCAPSPCFKARLSEKPVIWVKRNFFSHANRTHFDKNGFALTL